MPNTLTSRMLQAHFIPRLLASLLFDCVWLAFIIFAALVSLMTA
jgi:hypothetical protein